MNAGKELSVCASTRLPGEYWINRNTNADPAL